MAERQQQHPPLPLPALFAGTDGRADADDIRSFVGLP